MSTFVLCVGCGTPLYGFSPCQRCTCELCGNDLRDGFCSLCNSRNSCVYDPNPNSFYCPPDSCHPPHPTYETYSSDSYGNDSHFGYGCQPQFPLNYESEPCYIESYNSYPYDSLSFPQQELCCENCEVLSKADHCQTPQYAVNHPILNAHNDLLNDNNDLLNSQNKITIAQNKLMEQLTSMCAMILACYDDDDDSTITPNEPVDSLILNLSESEGESECDMPAREEFTTFSNILFNAYYKSTLTSITIMLSLPMILRSLFCQIFDSLLDEFAGELTLLKSIPPGIDETGCYPEEDIRLIERLLYDNSSPRPPEEFVSDNSNADIESFSPSPIPIKDSNSHYKEIDLTFTPDDLM
uniref:Pre-mRNA splicing Prp18-interacting factor n=1 Tax=Tanacetum cinerariifolium TaxID=118510 RepID=A0A699JV97_TANCI|nr:pre-mRNA splicing Prp18-interacting factor [Tanacetum cinerariifolium]